MEPPLLRAQSPDSDSLVRCGDRDDTSSMVRLAAIAVILASAVPAFGQEQGKSAPLPAMVAPSQGAPPPPPPPPTYVVGDAHRRRNFSVTFSPLHLASPIVELTFEIRAGEKVGIALIGGAGKYDTTLGGVKVSAAAKEAGFQLRYYALGDFQNGLQFGGELLYVHLSDSKLSTTGGGVAIGPFAGTKYTADFGFTFETQIGFQRVGVDTSRMSNTASGSEFILLLNINVGWSF